MRAGSLPISCSPISATAASTLRARPSTTGSPQPTRPSSVSILRNIQRGATRKVVSLVILMLNDSGYPPTIHGRPAQAASEQQEVSLGQILRASVARRIDTISSSREYQPLRATLESESHTQAECPVDEFHVLRDVRSAPGRKIVRLGQIRRLENHRHVWFYIVADGQVQLVGGLVYHVDTRDIWRGEPSDIVRAIVIGQTRVDAVHFIEKDDVKVVLGYVLQRTAHDGTAGRLRSQRRAGDVGIVQLGAQSAQQAREEAVALLICRFHTLQMPTAGTLRLTNGYLVAIDLFARVELLHV